MYRFGIQQIDAEVQMRPALSFGCLCFVLIGCPVGIWFSRSDYLSAFITCFLPIVFIYYPLMLCGTNYAKQGKLIPTLTSGPPTSWSAWSAWSCLASPQELTRRIGLLRGGLRGRVA